MTDLLSEAPAPLVQAPIAWVARGLLATDDSVKAVMVLGDDGKVLAHERALGFEEQETLEDDDHTVLFCASERRVIFFLRLSKQPSRDEYNRIQATISSPNFAITR
jgi:hypothetical protein